MVTTMPAIYLYNTNAGRINTAIQFPLQPDSTRIPGLEALD
jgi:hypothetical protein